ncbi:hypothetical protein FACHB389_20210 [Nostoc calcicola FACHB-389]|nr:hypothetical protein FACHB389_20210 [Nostoc calcicola FACHB-389]
MTGLMSKSRNPTRLRELIPFWILDFGFWIENCFLLLGCMIPSGAIIFQIGIADIFGFCANPSSVSTHLFGY